MRNRIVAFRNRRQRIILHRPPLIARQRILHHRHKPAILLRQRIQILRHKPRRSKLQGYRPKWAGTFEAFTKNEVRKNLWRFKYLNQEFEDILSEAYYKFLKCKKDYPIVDTPQHFMALYKTALHRRFYDLAMESTYYKDTVRVEDMYSTDDSDERVHILDKEYSEPFGSDLGLLLRKAPQEIKDVLRVVFEAPAEMITMFKKPRKQYSNVELSEKVGYSFDFRRKFNDYFIKGEL